VKAPAKPLNKLLGLDSVKEEISRLAYLAQAQTLRAARNMPYMPINLHSLFIGPAGTGKTTVARLFGRILHQLGYLEKGHVVEVDKSGMTGQFMGQTGPLVLQQVQRAEGGILFIDEAYALNDGYSSRGYGDEALSTLMKLMEDRRERFIVVAAGYDKEMEDFLKMNSGVRSRFPNKLEFSRYSNETLVQIFIQLCTENHYTLSKEVVDKLTAYIQNIGKEELDAMGNARLMRNIFEKTIAAQAARVIKGNLMDESFHKIEAEDLRYPKETPKVIIGF
jgi:SpoVK/Ycf46/Vps4 family AAA+-type ATPase